MPAWKRWKDQRSEGEKIVTTKWAQRIKDVWMMELDKSKRWSIICSMLIVTAACEEVEGDGDTEFSHVQWTPEGALTHKHDSSSFQDSTVLPGWTIC